jgi:branched-chain amino acid transport system substrate-binding protein
MIVRGEMNTIRRKVIVNKKRLLSILIPTLFVLLTTLIITSCSPQQTTPTPGQTTTPTPGQITTPTTPPSEDVKWIKIGSLGSWTGAYAPGGLPQEWSIRAATRIINDEENGFVVNGQRYKLELVEYDDRTDNKRAAAGMAWLIDQHGIKICHGPMSSPATLAAQPISEMNKVLTQNYAVAEDVTREGIKYSWSWASSGTTTSIYYSAFFKDVLKLKTLAFITENEAYCLSVRAATIPQCKAKGIEVVSDQQFDSGVIDFSTIIAKARLTNPDLLYVQTKFSTAMLVVKQVGEAGWHVQLTGSFAQSEAFAAIGKYLEGAITAVSPGYWTYKSDQWPEGALKAQGTDLAWFMRVADSYIGEFGDQQMDRFLFGYRQSYAFIKAMQKAGTVTDTDKIAAAFNGLEWDDAEKHQRALANRRFKLYSGFVMWHESTKADKFDVLSVMTHTDDYQLVWTSQEIMKCPTIDEIRKTRGY